MSVKSLVLINRRSGHAETSVERFREIANCLIILARELSLKAYQNVQQARVITERKQVEESLKLTQFALLNFLTFLSGSLLVGVYFIELRIIHNVYIIYLIC